MCVCVCVCEQDLDLNIQQSLILNKTPPNKTI